MSVDSLTDEAFDSAQGIIDYTNEWEAPEAEMVTDEDSENYLKVLDGDGNVVADYSNLAPGLDELGDYADEYQTYEDWVADMAAQGIDVSQGSIDDYQTDVDTLTANMETITEEEQQEAAEYSAGLMGMTDEERDLILNQLEGVVTGETEVEGYSDQERAIMDRQISRKMAEMSEYANRMVNNIMASTGAMTPALAAADNYTNNISNYAIQAGTQLIEDELALKQTKIESQQRMWEYMVTQGSMGEQQFLDNMFQAQSLALEGYMSSMSSVLQENEQHLSLYKADQDAITNAMNATYNGVMATLGVNEALSSQMQQFIENAYLEANTTMTMMVAELSALDSQLEDARLAEQEAEDAAAEKTENFMGWLTVAGGAIVTVLGIAAGASVVAAAFAPAIVAGGMTMMGTGGDMVAN